MLAAGAVLLAAASAFAEALVVYDFEGSNLNASATHHAVSATAFTHNGSGTPGFDPGNPGDAYRAGSWPTDDTLAKYFSFTMTIDEGWIASIDALAFDALRSTDGPTNWVVHYSVNGSDFYPLGAGVNGVSFAGKSANDTLPADITGTVYFRLYAWNAASGAGRWRLDNVTVNATLTIDDGTRRFRSHSFDGIHSDNWGHATNAGAALIDRSSNKFRSGTQSLRLCGSASLNVDPFVVFDNVSLLDVQTNVLGDVEPIVLSLGFAADNPDSGDNLELAISYDNGTSWAGAGTAQLVAGFGNQDIEFDATSASNPTTVDANPYTVTLSFVQTQIAVRVTFDESTGPNTADHYYIDDIQLTGVPVPDTNGPSMGNYSGPSAIQTSQATISGHVRGGYPYPLVRLYWGPQDGGTNASAWAYHETFGTSRWGLVSTTVTNLLAGQQYFYRSFGSNPYGDNWADHSTNFTTLATALNSSEVMYLDSFGVADVMPLAIDQDLNGLPDRWEIQYLGGTGNDPGADPDGDGVDTGDEFTAGTHPDQISDMMEIVDVDVAGDASANVVVTWVGGAFNGPSTFSAAGDRVSRQYHINAASADVNNSKLAQAAVTAGLTGTNTWTDTNAANAYDSRYYDLSVFFAGSGYTNSEPWGMYVQDREPNAQFLICVPVEHYAASQRNLNSTLGRQLARGLHAAANTNAADEIRFFDSNGVWYLYHLITDNNGGYWSDDFGATTADVPISAGMAMWVERRAGAVTRNNSVLGGRLFTQSTITNFTFGVGDDEFTMFGWALPEPRAHVRNGTATATNQLGFAALGSGGTANLLDPESKRGDRIWVWADNEWQTFYELMDNVGPDWDGRWWHRANPGGPDYADFQLEPGRGYYYRHVTNEWGGVPFDWTPEEP